MPKFEVPWVYVQKHLGFPIASTAVIAPLYKAFVHAIEVFAKAQQIDPFSFTKHQRKDEVTQGYLARTSFTEGVLYIGKAPEKALFSERFINVAPRLERPTSGLAAAQPCRTISTSTCWTKTSGRCS
jgi:hypothetical protein